MRRFIEIWTSFAGSFSDSSCFDRHPGFLGVSHSIPCAEPCSRSIDTKKTFESPGADGAGLQKKSRRQTTDEYNLLLDGIPDPAAAPNVVRIAYASDFISNKFQQSITEGFDKQ